MMRCSFAAIQLRESSGERRPNHVLTESDSQEPEKVMVYRDTGQGII